DEMFVNSVVEVETLYTHYELLDAIHQIEQNGNRVRKERWGNRTLDVDIIFYDDIVVGDSELAIPHPDMVNRDFVLTPMMEMNENFVHTLLNKRIKDLKA
ncbi:MAG: 2-amino-4-hydroxy-6-hydroxymethyldihydropteridine diphosphokinase, partial [Clostridia bacterium]|nr:2-amino-4-hydroxy-6-hydroxymethyldihydropteridine diphosphokinase [Clostridia bacterium]